MAKEELKFLKSKQDGDKDDSVILGLLALPDFPQNPKADAGHTKSNVTSRKRKQSHKDDHAEKLTSQRRKQALAQSCALKRAEEVRANLDPQYPILVKYMLPSHISSCFWLGLPLNFCKSYLPKKDEMITLISENGDEYPVKYLAEKSGLSGRWRGFSILHKLVEGDVLVFHLIKPTSFKVYIIRENELADIDGTLSLLHLDARAKPTEPGKAVKTAQNFPRKRVTFILPEENDRSTSPSVSGLDIALTSEQTGNDSEEVDSEIKFSKSAVEFKDVTNIESFTIRVNGLIIDSEISKFVKTKYYDLCRSQNAFLHDHLLKVISPKLVVGIISETVNISDAIAVGKLTTTPKEFTIWDKSLIAFGQLGMNVGFLRTRLKQLMNLARESEQAMDSKRYREALLRKTEVEEETRTTKSKLSELKEASKKVETEIEYLKVKAERFEVKFQAEASAHW
ncbi:B3 domain-containing protein, partial [Thalictrum thalictroides]